MSNLKEQQAIWEKHWTRLIDKEMNLDIPKPRRISIAFELLAKPKYGESILEAGSGLGLHTLHFAKRFNLRAVLLDISKKALCFSKRVAKSKGLSCDFVLGDVLNLPFVENSFDIVWNDGVNGYFQGKDRQRVFDEMIRVAAFHGRIVVIVPNKLSMLYWFLKLIRGYFIWGYSGFEDPFTPKELIKRMQKTKVGEILFVCKFAELWYMKPFRYLSQSVRIAICGEKAGPTRTN